MLNPIWQPFLDGVNQDKPALYNSVNAKDFNWVRGGNGKTRIMNEQEYREDARIVMEDRKKKGIAYQQTIKKPGYKPGLQPVPVIF
ncbi:hypothetical protein [Paraflavitalea soli]|nr:hypothetical protein [Paraflavitalea soli]